MYNKRILRKGYSVSRDFSGIKNYNLYYIFLNSGSQFQSPLLRSQDFMPPLILDRNFIKWELKNCYPYDRDAAVINTSWEPNEWDTPYLEPAVQLIIRSGSLATPCNIHKVLQQTWRHFTSLKQCKCSQIPLLSPRVTSTSNRNALNYATSLAIRLRESSKIPTGNKRNIALTSLPHSLDQHQKQKDETLDSSSVLISLKIKNYCY